MSPPVYQTGGFWIFWPGIWSWLLNLAILRTWPFWDGENVKTWPFKWLYKWPPNRGIKFGHKLNHLELLAFFVLEVSVEVVLLEVFFFFFFFFGCSKYLHWLTNTALTEVLSVNCHTDSGGRNWSVCWVVKCDFVVGFELPATSYHVPWANPRFFAFQMKKHDFDTNRMRCFFLEIVTFQSFFATFKLHGFHMDLGRRWSENHPSPKKILLKPETHEIWSFLLKGDVG